MDPPTLSLEEKKDSWGSCGRKLSSTFQLRGNWHMPKTAWSGHLLLAEVGFRVIKSNKSWAHSSIVALGKQIQGPGRHPQSWGLAERSSEKPFSKKCPVGLGGWR